MAYEMHVCDVCKLVDGDEQPKLSAFCSVCSAWICKACYPQVTRRAEAWNKRRLQNK